MKWFTERLYGTWHARYRVEEELVNKKTAYQRLRIIVSPTWGRMLILDDITQATEKDEFIYHEMMTHAPLVAHGACKRVLVIGGGDGGMLREVLKHPVERVVQVEIDEEVVRACREHMPTLSAGAFDDPRTELVIADGAKYLRGTDERFDAVLVDSSDPVGPAKVLFQTRFYRDLLRVLTPRGVVSRQCGAAMLQPGELADCAGRMGRVFPHTAVYLAAIPTYVGGLFSFVLAGRAPGAFRVPKKRLEDRIRRLRLRTRCYNADVHHAGFALPNYVKEILK